MLLPILPSSLPTRIGSRSLAVPDSTVTVFIPRCQTLKPPGSLPVAAIGRTVPELTIFLLAASQLRLSAAFP